MELVFLKDRYDARWSLFTRNYMDEQSILLLSCFFMLSKLTAVAAGYSLKYMAELVSIVLLQEMHCYTNGRKHFAVNLKCYVLACKAIYKIQHSCTVF